MKQFIRINHVRYSTDGIVEYSTVHHSNSTAIGFVITFEGENETICKECKTAKIAEHTLLKIDKRFEQKNAFINVDQLYDDALISSTY